MIQIVRHEIPSAFNLVSVTVSVNERQSGHISPSPLKTLKSKWLQHSFLKMISINRMLGGAESCNNGKPSQQFRSEILMMEGPVKETGR